ncbi:MAG: hypothetical protein EA339_07645 [Rhodobacteraceae bacterium]|nr:MAG: hypothetical protein EA339_07645 [Paracoccaceae bacterium]
MPELELVAIFGVFTAAGAVILLLAALLRLALARVSPGFDSERDTSRPVVVLDGSNVMHWKDGKPDLQPVRDVIADLAQRGYRAGVVFDANAGYKLEGRYRHHQVLARQLGLPQNRVMVVNKGEVADEMVLRVAQDFGARVVSNDRFRDWRDDFPQVAEPGFLISGRYRQGALQLDL